MALPKIEAPKYTCTLPLSGKKVDFRPFLAQEERILLMASESKSPAAYIVAIKDIVQACTYGKVDADNLISIDLEFLFLNLRLRAVGETVQIGKVCSNTSCNNQLQHVVKFDDIKFEHIEDYNTNKKIDIGNGLGIIMKAPSPELASELESSDITQTEKMYMLIKASTETIYDADQMYKAADYSDEELTEFLDQLPIATMQKIGKFFEEQPKMVYLNQETCKKCNNVTEIKLEGMSDFFM